jgi:hypothetical protein
MKRNCYYRSSRCTQGQGNKSAAATRGQLSARESSRFAFLFGFASQRLASHNMAINGASHISYTMLPDVNVISQHLGGGASWRCSVTKAQHISKLVIMTVIQLLVIANAVPSSLIRFTPMMEATCSSETSVLTRSTRHS